MSHMNLVGGDNAALKATFSRIVAEAENPGFPRFLDTRGIILMKMDRWNVALADLETAVRELPNAPTVHVKLAEIYDRLGFRVIAESHRELARKQPEPGE